MNSSTKAAVECNKRGFVPVPIVGGDKRPGVAGWTSLTFDTEQHVVERFDEWATQGMTNVGVLLGEASGNLVDVDIDHPRAMRLRDFFLPPTPAKSGHGGRRGSHYWYICQEGTLPGTTRQHRMPKDADGKKGPVAVELRSNRSQSVIPPSVHPSGNEYLWEGKPWGGKSGPAEVDGRVLSARVAMLGLAAVLLDHWPTKGSRHEAYLALAGGLLRQGDQVHPFWGERANAAEQLIRALADASNDEDGSDARVSESIHTTIDNIRKGNPVTGFRALSEIIGEEHVKQARILVAEVEQAAGYVSRQATDPKTSSSSPSVQIVGAESHSGWLGVPATQDSGDIADTGGDKRDRDPLEERVSTWLPVDLDPYLTGQVKPVEPTVLLRDDGQALMYPGRVNMLYGSSESAKSWIALQTAIQVMATGERVVFLDLEDEPVNTLSRMLQMGASPDDLRKQFAYVHPEDPLAPMQKDSWGKPSQTERGQMNYQLFLQMMEAVDPTLLIADGMTVLYGLHGLSTNDTTETEVITGWLKSLTRNGRTTVIVIDHTGKGAAKGDSPIGSQHKTSMVQGSLIQAYVIRQPMPGAVGEVELVVTKDRPGFVRAASLPSGGGKAQVAAVVRMDSTVKDVVDMTIAPPPDPAAVAASGVIDLKTQREAERQQRFRDHEETIKILYRGKNGSRKTMAQIRSLIKPEAMTDKEIGQALARLIDQGWIVKTDKDGVPSDKATKNAMYELILGDAGYSDPADDTD